MTQPRHRSHPTDGPTAALAVPRLSIEQAAEVLAALPELQAAERELAARGEWADAGAVQVGGAPAKQPQVTSGPRVGNQAAMASAGRSTRGHSTSRAG